MEINWQGTGPKLALFHGCNYCLKKQPESQQMETDVNESISDGQSLVEKIKIDLVKRGIRYLIM